MDNQNKIILFTLCLILFISQSVAQSDYFYAFDREIADSTGIQVVKIPKRFVSLESLNLSRFTDLKEVEISYQENWQESVKVLASIEKLEVLIIKDAQLKDFPKSIIKLKNLKKLVLEENDIAVIPAFVDSLHFLTELTLANNKIEYCLIDFGNFSHLKKLNLSNNEIDSLIISAPLLDLGELNLSRNNLNNLPANFVSGTNLRAFKASRNKIKEVPNELWNNRNLMVLHLKQNDIEFIDEGLNNCSKLSYLNLSRNPITDLPDRLELPNLEVLKISELNLKEAPRFKDLSSLQTLEISENKLKVLPEGISKLDSLKKVDISFNDISDINELMSLCRLEELFAIGNTIVDIDFSNSCLSNLRLLSLNSNKLKSISFSSLTSIEEIELRDNQLIDIKLAHRLHMLTDIDLGENSFNRIPADLIKAENLKKLDFSFNEVTDVKDIELFHNLIQFECIGCGLSEFPVLDEPSTIRNLVISNNSIKELDLINYNNLVEIDVSNNPITVLHRNDLPKLDYFDLSGSALNEIDLESLQKEHQDKIIIDTEALNDSENNSQ